VKDLPICKLCHKMPWLCRGEVTCMTKSCPLYGSGISREQWTVVMSTEITAEAAMERHIAIQKGLKSQGSR